MEETTRAVRTVFEGRIFRVEVLDVELSSGRVSTREIVRHPGAVVILARLADGRFVFVRQYRKALEEIVLEAVAGTLEPGESPIACAARELEEETGYRAARLEPLGVICSAPGYADERLHVFYAEVTGAAGDCHPDEDEELDVVTATEDELGGWIRSGQIYDSKTLAAWSLFRERPALGEGCAGAKDGVTKA